jgi:hypothetical protein
MVQVAAERPSDLTEAPIWRQSMLLLAVLPLAALLGYLGFVLPTPGVSLAYPAVVILGVGSAAAIGSLLLAGRQPRLASARDIPITSRKRDSVVKTFAIVAGLITVAATVWTIELGMPASLEWSSGATTQAESVLARVSRSPQVSAGVPRKPCLYFDSGQVGPVHAPYTACAVLTSDGGFVTFVSQGASGGIEYIKAGTPGFEDQCYRRLVGDWYSFGAEPGALGECPFGYRYSGAA